MTAHGGVGDPWPSVRRTALRQYERRDGGDATMHDVRKRVGRVRVCTIKEGDASSARASPEIVRMRAATGRAHDR